VGIEQPAGSMANFFAPSSQLTVTPAAMTIDITFVKKDVFER
jgi:hypothetical protein